MMVHELWDWRNAPLTQTTAQRVQGKVKLLRTSHEEFLQKPLRVISGGSPCVSA